MVISIWQSSPCSHLGTTRLPSSFDQDSFAWMGSNTFSVEELSGFGLSSTSAWVSFPLADSLLGFESCFELGSAEGLFGGVAVPAASFVSEEESTSGTGVFGLKKPFRLLCEKPPLDFAEFSLLSVALPFF